MWCCPNCFKVKHQHLIQYIKDNSKLRGACGFCGSKKVPLIEPNELDHLFTPLLQCYAVTTIGEHMMPDDDILAEGDFLSKLIQDDFDVFSDEVESADQSGLILEAIWNDPSNIKDGGFLFDSSEFWSRRDKNFIERPSVDLWDAFSDYIKHKRRFIFDEQDPEIIDPRYGISSQLKELKRALYVEDKFYRARRYEHSLDEMGAPINEKILAGRANPEGIPFLYLSTDYATAVAELRPWKGLTVTVAEFRLLEDLNIVDLSHISHEVPSPFGLADKVNLYNLLQNHKLLEHLNLELSKPVDPRKPLDYLPTQYLTEIIRAEGYDGMMYKSSMGRGENLVIFSEEKAKPVLSDLYSIHDVYCVIIRFKSD